MVTKFRVVQRAKLQRARFLELFRADRQPLHLYQERVRFEGAPVFAIYKAGCRELCFQLLGSAEVDETFRARLDSAPRISPAQMRVVGSAMERAVGETALRLESQMILLATAVSGAPFLGLLGTVWGVMDTFSDVATAGSANLTAMAPGVSAALITTVTGLLVAIPAMFGYNFLVTRRIRWDDRRVGRISPPNSPASSSTNMWIMGREARAPFVVCRDCACFRSSAFEPRPSALRRFTWMRRFSSHTPRPHHAPAELNVTPLLDLAFVLLIIFMITTPLMENSVDLVVPTSDATKNPVNPSTVQTVSIDREERLQFNGEAATREQVASMLAALHDTNADVAVVIRAHKDLPVQKLVDLLHVVKRAHINRIGVVTTPDQP